ncbi:MAG: 50S ribosomal protein L16 [Candidatus Nezhaarchaeota archaeon]|nr:50S ribosomal protein L16 [Candidatus Nezhaarchaeota archaeon]
MPIRPARCYTSLRGPAYTRREYIGSGLTPKVVKFRMGNPHGDFDVELRLVAKEAGQVRHNALEAARVMASKLLSSALTEQGYYLVIHVYPHHVLRENKMMAFAGADRLQDGMRLAFGDPIGLAARIQPGLTIMSVKTRSEKVQIAKQALKRAASKLPIPCRIIVEPINRDATTP